MTAPESLFAKCARLIEQADGILIGAGAGIGVDSGLPDFRGEHGFWKVYPALGRAGIRFESIANPEAFESNPKLAWGFYGHRLNLYRQTVPHEGFMILRNIAAKLPHGAFVYTSNVDGHFQKAGFGEEHIHECHGSLHHLQCLDDSCTREIWPADDFKPKIDQENRMLLSAPPHCPVCGGLARPNVMMFGDFSWHPGRQRKQARRWPEWRHCVTKLVVIELGAGTDIPSVRRFCESVRAPLIRINPREPQLGEARGVSLPMGALEAMRGIHATMP